MDDASERIRASDRASIGRSVMMSVVDANECIDDANECIDDANECIDDANECIDDVNDGSLL